MCQDHLRRSTMTLGGNGSDDTNRTADHEKGLHIVSHGDRCSCQSEDTFVCANCQNEQFAQHVKQKEIFVGGQDCKTRLIERINGGSFGDIYLGALETENSQQVAVKIERQKPSSQQLLYEGTVYRKLEGGPGIPRVHWFGMHGSQYNALVMDLMGPSLQELFERCKNKFSLKTVLLIIDQVLDVIEHIHCQNFVHRDISPNNFMIGRGPDSHKIYLIDYGHAKKYNNGHQVRSGRNHLHYARGLVGTPRYSSIHAHMGHEAAPRDDLEAIGYTWIYFLKGRLPWQGLKVAHMHDKIHQVAEVKKATSLASLCEGLPTEFPHYLKYARSLGRTDTPDYCGIKELFQDLAKRENYQYDGGFDWCMEQSPSSQLLLPQATAPRTSLSSLASTCSPVSH